MRPRGGFDVQYSEAQSPTKQEKTHVSNMYAQDGQIKGDDVDRAARKSYIPGLATISDDKSTFAGCSAGSMSCDWMFGYLKLKLTPKKAKHLAPNTN